MAKRRAEIANLRAVRGIDQVRQVDRAKRSGEIAKLRAEVELLQLETEAAKSQLVELMGAARKAETRTVLDPIANPLEMPVNAQEAVELLSKAASGDSSAIARIESWFEKLVEKAQAGTPDAIQIYKTFMGMQPNEIAKNTNGVIPAGVRYVGVGEPVPVPAPAKADPEGKGKTRTKEKRGHSANRQMSKRKTGT